MVKAVYDRTTLLYVSGSRWDDIPHDPVLFVQLSLRAFPDPITTRLNARADDIRDATTAEIQAQRDAVVMAINIDDMIAVLEDKGVLTRAEVQAKADARRP